MELLPQSLATGRPITVVMPEGTKGMVRVTSLSATSPLSFEVGLTENEGRPAAQFVVALPGRYRVEAAGQSAEVFVPPQENLSFTVEFGLFTFVVVLTVLRMVLWMRSNRKGTRPGVGPI